MLSSKAVAVAAAMNTQKANRSLAKSYQIRAQAGEELKWLKGPSLSCRTLCPPAE